MRDEEFKNKLSQVSDWYIPTDIDKVPKNNKRILAKLDQGLSLDTSDGSNTTYPPTIARIKTQGCQCQDCGKWCEQGRKVESRKYLTNMVHWRNRCVTCNRWQHPDTKEFNLTPSSSASYYNHWVQRQIRGQKCDQD